MEADVGVVIGENKELEVACGRLGVIIVEGIVGVEVQRGRAGGKDEARDKGERTGEQVLMEERRLYRVKDFGEVKRWAEEFEAHVSER